MVHISSPEGGEHVPVVDPVLISLLDGIFLSVKVCPYSADSEDSDIPGQESVQGLPKVGRIPLLFESTVGHLPQRVGPRVSSPGAHYCDLFSGKGAQCVCDRALDCLLIFLDLPACETAAVVLEEDFVFGQWSVVPSSVFRVPSFFGKPGTRNPEPFWAVAVEVVIKCII